MIQQELEFYDDLKERKPNFYKDVEKFVEFKTDCRRWETAKDIHNISGWTDRYCRELASMSEGRIISGNLGYKATVCATSDEINHSCSRLFSQATKMWARAFAIKRVAHNNLTNRKETT